MVDKNIENKYTQQFISKTEARRNKVTQFGWVRRMNIYKCCVSCKNNKKDEND